MWHRVTLVRLLGHSPVKSCCLACPLKVGGGKECRHVSSRQGARPETWLQRAAWTLESMGQSSSSWQTENWWLASKDRWVTKKVGFNMASSLPVKLDLSSPHRMQLGWSHAFSHWRRWGSGEGGWPQAPSPCTRERRGCHRKPCPLVNNLSSQ